MNSKIEKLGDGFEENLAAIRLAVGKQTGARMPWNEENPIDLAAQGDRMVRCYENWLLDDEQKQILSVQPYDRFILYASSYVCDIGLTDSQNIATLTKDFKDDSARELFIRSLSEQSSRLIRDYVWNIPVT